MTVMFCLLRTLGDVVLGTTLVHEYRRVHPDAAITWFVNEPYDQLLVGNPDVAAVRTSSDWAWDALFFEMARGGWDAVVAPYQMRPEDGLWHQDPATRHQHLLDFYWRRMGMHDPIIERRSGWLYPSDADRSRAASLVSFDQPRIAVHTTTGVPTKDWPAFDALVEACRQAGYACVQVGAAADRRAAGAIDLRGKFTLLELAAFLGQCAAFVGLDSGVSYMADAMGCPSVILQGSTDPVTSGPIGPTVTHLFAPETGYADCQTVRCHTTCRHERNCITIITVDQVLDALEPLVARWRSPIPILVPR